jgi:cbb3-type cytochrome oxidase cytochrome c subunit
VVLKDKTSDQAKAEIAAAARAVCLREARGVVYTQEAIATCVKDARTQAMAEAEVTLARMKAAETLAKK